MPHTTGITTTAGITTTTTTTHITGIEALGIDR